jgi:hypothetical protein
MSLDIQAFEYRRRVAEFERRLEEIRMRGAPAATAQVEKYEIPFLTAEKIYEQGFKVMESNKFFAAALLGPQGTGKTTIIQKLVSLAMQDKMKIVYAMPEDFMSNIDAWIARVLAEKAERYCLVVEDLSYAMETQKRQTQAKIKNVVARFRHIFDGEMFVVYVTHRLHAAPPIMRNAWTWIFTTMQSADREDALKVVGRTKEMRDQLEAIYSLISNVSVRGPDEKIIRLELNGKQMDFEWGDAENPGDGRLMAAYHSGKLEIFQNKMTLDDLELDLEKFRYRENNEETMFD